MNKGIVVGGGHSLRAQPAGIYRQRGQNRAGYGDLRIGGPAPRLPARRCRGGCGDGDRRRMAFVQGL